MKLSTKNVSRKAWFCAILALGVMLPSWGLAEGKDDYVDKIPGTLVTFTMVAIPTCKLGNQEIKKIWIGKTEVTWDEYDQWAFQMDLTEKQKAEGFDAKSRPSKPYGAPDRGFGHHLFPAGSIAFNAAQNYCKGLRAKPGTKYRLH